MTSSQAGVKQPITPPPLRPFLCESSPPSPHPLRFQLGGAPFPSSFCSNKLKLFNMPQFIFNTGSRRAGSQGGCAQPPWEWKQLISRSGRDPEVSAPVCKRGK